MIQPNGCPRCFSINIDGTIRKRGQIYVEQYGEGKAEYWCLQCGEWIIPDDYQILPYAPGIDSHSIEITNPDDLYDLTLEYVLESPPELLRVSSLARHFGVAPNMMKQVFERLRDTGVVRPERYGPADRYVGYRRYE